MHGLSARTILPTEEKSENNIKDLITYIADKEEGVPKAYPLLCIKSRSCLMEPITKTEHQVLRCMKLA